jgi:hypothetical protein
MQHSEARVQTTTPARYLGQLCKHFAHKIPVTLEADTGSIAFPAGLCRLATDVDTLILHVEAPDAAALAQVQDVVARHLLRFAFREPPTIEWHGATDVQAGS